MAEKSLHGYDAVFVPSLDKKYSCPVCLAALRDPVQTSCGHRFCHACLKMSFGNKKKGRCPVDKKWCSLSVDVFQDLAVKREVLSLAVKCQNYKKQCEWQGELRDLKTHEDECPKMELTCDLCNVSMLRCDLSAHKPVCPQRLEACSHCETNVAFADIPKHQLLMCRKFPVNCGICCEPGILREDIQQHVDIENGDCPLVIVPCKFKHIGCYFQDKRKNMYIHYDTAGEHHLMLLSTVVAQNEETIAKQAQMIRQFETDVEMIKNFYTEQERKLMKHLESISNIENRIINSPQLKHSNGVLLWQTTFTGHGNSKTISPAFYTVGPGYKLMLVFDPKGFTELSRSFASVKVHLLSSEFDQHLKFPFEARCRVSVLKENMSSDFSVCFKLSASSPAVAEEENGACIGAVKKFVSLNDLQRKRLIYNGKITLDVCVDVVSS